MSQPSFASDPAYQELVDLYVDALPDRAGAIANATRLEDWREVNRLSHQLKGSAGGYGFDVMSRLAAKVEYLSEDARASTALASAIENLCNECDEVVERRLIQNARTNQDDAPAEASGSPEAAGAPMRSTPT